MMWWSNSGMDLGNVVAMVVGVAVFWALAIVAAIVVVRYLARYDRIPSAGATPEQVLGARFAGGEIDEREYRSIRDVLREPQSVIRVAG